MYLVTKENRQNNCLDELIFNENLKPDTVYMTNRDDSPYTRYQQNKIDKLIEHNKSTIESLNQKITQFLQIHPEPSQMYRHYTIPKASGGVRHIDEPEEELKELQKQITIIMQQIGIYNTQWAWAYTPKRCAIDMAEQHKTSKWVLKIDLKNFFPSLNRELIKNQLMKNYYIAKISNILNIDNLITVALLNDQLPQGSPLSPYLSNLVMIEFDWLLRNVLPKNKIYTRYADDIIISSIPHLPKTAIVSTIEKILTEQYGSQIRINYSKVKLQKNTHRLYIVGVKLNKDNELTFGHEKKKKLKLDLYNLFKAYEQNTACKEEAQELLGLFTYMKQIEPDYANWLERKYLKQFHSTAKSIYKHFKF